ncbi:MAG: YbjQ family protein [Candidatus Thorarchaeota archaeon]
MMLICSVDSIVGVRVSKTLGIVSGSCVMTKHIGKDLMAGMRSIIGGEAVAYSRMLEESRFRATVMMERRAKKMGANAVIGVRYVSPQTMAGASEMVAYGTAVKIVKPKVN